MSGLLALVGGGEFTQGCTFDRTLLDTSGAEEVLVLPTGAAYEHPERSVERAVSWFEAWGARARGLDVLRRADALDDGKVEAVRAAPFVYLTGASPMHLRSVLMHSPLWDALLEGWRDGATVAGSTGGAQVLCDPMVDPRGGAFTLGLGLVENLAVIPDHDHWSPEALHRTRALATDELVLVGVDRHTAVIRRPDGTWTAEGAGGVTVHVGNQESRLDQLRL